MSTIKRNQELCSLAMPMNGAYLVYWYTDTTRGHRDDPEAYRTLKQWHVDVLDRHHPDPVTFTMGIHGMREAYVDAGWFDESNEDES